MLLRKTQNMHSRLYGGIALKTPRVRFNNFKALLSKFLTVNLTVNLQEGKTEIVEIGVAMVYWSSHQLKSLLRRNYS